MALSTFEQQEYLLYTKLNTLVAEIEAKFAAIGTSNLTWPLQAGGSIDMDGNVITNMPQLWNIINADEYDTLQLAVDEASATGGCVLIPPETTIPTTGITISKSGVWIVGCGPSSIITFETGETDPMIQSDTSSRSNIGIMNLQLDGSAGTGAKGVVMKNVSGFRMGNCILTGFKADSIYLTYGATTTNSCTDAWIWNTNIYGGSGTGYHVHGDSIDGLVMVGVHSNVSPAGSFVFAPADASAPVKNFVWSGIRAETPTGKGISITGLAVAGAGCSNYALSNCLVSAPTGIGIELGAASLFLRDVSMIGCQVTSPGDDAFNININRGSIIGCYGAQAIVAGKDGLDMLDSVDVFVTGCNFQDAADCGIVIDSATASDCTIVGNNVRDCVTPIKRPTTDRGHIISANPGDYVSYVANPTLSVTGVTTATEFGLNYSIPAGCVQIGDMIRVTGTIIRTNTNAVATIGIRVGGTNTSLCDISATADGRVDSEIYVAAISGAGSAVVTTTGGHDTGKDNPDIFYNSLTVDWTAAVEIDFVVDPDSASDSFALRNVIIEFIRRNEV